MTTFYTPGFSVAQLKQEIEENLRSGVYPAENTVGYKIWLEMDTSHIDIPLKQYKRIVWQGRGKKITITNFLGSDFNVITNSSIDPRFCGIYGIFHKTKRKVYIGQSKDIRNRFVCHKSTLRSNKHYCASLQKDFNDCRFDDPDDLFSFDIIMLADKKTLTDKETRIACDFMKKGWFLYSKHLKYVQLDLNEIMDAIQFGDYQSIEEKLKSIFNAL